MAGEQDSHERVMAIWDEVRPDVVVTDNVTGYPAIELAGAPWVRVVSCNPLELPDDDLPPALSGLPSRRPARVGRRFATSTTGCTVELLAEHNDFRLSVGVPACPPDQFNATSPWLNLYEFPAAADYPRAAPLDAHLAPPRVVGAQRRGELRPRRAPARRRQGGLPLAGLARAAWTSP